MSYHVRNLLATPAPPPSTHPSLEAALAAIEAWKERHVFNGESFTVLAGTHVANDAGEVVWRARPASQE